LECWLQVSSTNKRILNNLVISPSAWKERRR
jgi:hypothetical protein